MTTKLANFLNQLQVADAEALRQNEAEDQAIQSALGENADARLRAFFADQADDLWPLIFNRSARRVNGGKHRANSFRVEWELGSHELQLARTTIIWNESCPQSLEFQIDTDVRRYTNQSPLNDILLFMRQAYPSYKTHIAQETQRQAAKRKDLITQLSCPANWRYTDFYATEERVQERYQQLVALGAQPLADQRLAEYRADVEAVRQREEAAATRKAAYETAMAEYGHQMAAYNIACQEWAATEQARLWQPWTLWRVRYTPWHAQCSVEDVDRFPIESICTLDAPEDIVNNANPIAHVEMVDTFGGVTEGFAIATFLDAKPIHFNVCPPIDEGRANYHRTRYAGDYAVNIPAWNLDEPAPAPIRPNAPSKDDSSDQW